MSHDFQAEPFDVQPPDIARDVRRTEPPRDHPPLPPWLARRLLRPGEHVTWVTGPRFNPSWEKYVTHIGLFGAAVALGLALVLIGWIAAGSFGGMSFVYPLLALALIIGSVIVLGFFNGLFTRLVATTHRLVIMQGYEIARTWQIDQLPRSLTRYRRRSDGGEERTLDLDAMRSMLGTASDQFADAKTILAFGKELGHIKAREDDDRR